MDGRLAFVLLLCVASNAAFAISDTKLTAHGSRHLLNVCVSPSCDEGATLSDNGEVEKKICHIEEGIDLEGGDMKTVPDVEQLCGCCFFCKWESGCKAWVYNSATRDCYLKSKSPEELKEVPCDNCVASKSQGSKFYKCFGSKTQMTMKTTTTTTATEEESGSTTASYGSQHGGAGGSQQKTTKTYSSEGYSEYGAGASEGTSTKSSETYSSEGYSEYGAGAGAGEGTSTKSSETYSSEGYSEHGGGEGTTTKSSETYSSEGYSEYGAGAGEGTTTKSSETYSSEGYSEHGGGGKQTTTETYSSESYSEHGGGGSGGAGYSSEKHEATTTESQKPSVMLSQEELQASLGSVPKYGVDVGVAQATGAEKCRIKEGYDQPAEYDMLDKPLILSSSFLCCDACAANPVCKSWVWNQGTTECFLKNEYKAEKNTIACASCIAYCAEGSQYVYSLSAGKKTTHASTTSKHESETTTHASTTSTHGSETTTQVSQEQMKYYTYIFGQSGWGTYTGSEKTTCTVIVGYDQPQDFDLPGMPIDANDAFVCCDKCSTTSGCKSWVWHSQSKKCFLKKNYDFRRVKEIKCDDCVGYTKKGDFYVFASQSGGGSGQSESAGKTASSTASTEKTTVSSETTVTTTKWKTGFFGGGVGWQTVTAGDTSNKCVFSTGFDQPADFNLIPQPLSLATALMCCDSCGQNNQCKSWVWNSKTKQCFLKNNYDERRNNIKCDDCVAYSKTGKYFLVLGGSSSSETSAGKSSTEVGAGKSSTEVGAGGSSTEVTEAGSSSESASRYVQQKDLSWAHEYGIWMPKQIAKKTCKISKGYDQPAEYNIHSQPLKVEFSFECCNECAKVDECKSWVFKSESKECYLKNFYDASRKTPCSDCIAYASGSRQFVYQKEATVTITITTITTGWTQETFGGCGWKTATGSETCRFEVGKDQPSEYDLLSNPLYLDTPYMCCEACNQNEQCKSWVWKATHKSCYLKNHYDESKSSECSDCVAYSQGGKYYLVTKYVSTTGGSSGDVSAGSGDISVGSSSRTQEKDLSWVGEAGIWMPKEIAAKTCTISKGYDQPAEYNIHDKPLKVQFIFQCCNECAKLNECKSWVFKSNSEECYLKNYYDASKKNPCSDCVAYDSSSRQYVYQTEAEKTVTVTITTTSTEWTKDTFGGSGWAAATGSESCRFAVGKDQPSEYDLLPNPLYLDTPFMCCEACNQNEQCKSWVWKATYKSCHLKNRYDESKGSSCSDCVAYSKGGTYYLLSKYTKSSSSRTQEPSTVSTATTTTTTVTAAEQKDLSWASEACIWMPKNIAKKICTVASGYDQSAEYNIHSQPLKLDFAFECCNECAKVNECQSWVFKASSKECYLKNQYDGSQTIPCKDCIAYISGRQSFVYQTQVTITKTFPLDSSHWETTTFGGSGWTQATQSDVCRFAVGRDQSADYDISVPIYTANPFECCSACKENNQCKSWVWKATYQSCHLKNHYDASKETTCCDCVSYSEEGSYSVTAKHSGYGSGVESAIEA